MLKLARLHFHECGYVDSYKDSLTIDLRDPRDGRLLDAVFNFENGGGKTGMLSLFFSCFDTRLDRFLRTLIRKHERFDHEFGDKPGAIIAEWAMPSNTASLMRDDPRRLITVQLVRQVRRAGVEDLERHFLLFRCGPTFDFEALLSSLRPDGRASVSRDQVPEFLHRLRADIKPVQFWDTTNQEQWKARLEENGLDVDLLRMQVDFNREEGGIDHFLDIKDEREFLLKFLNLTLNPQTAESTRTVLLENINKLGERQSLKDRFTVLQGLRTVFALFSLATAHWLALLARLATGRAEAAGLAVALEAARSSAHQAEQIAKAALEQTQKQLQSLAREIADAEAMQAALAHEDLRRRQLRAALALKEGIELNRQAKEDQHLWQAAIARRDIVRIEGEVETLRTQIDLADKDLAAPRQHTRRLGAQLYAALGQAIAAHDQSLQQINADEKRHKAQADELTHKAQRIAAETQRQMGLKTGATIGIATHDKQRANLERTQVGEHALLLSSETTVDALQRWERQQAERKTAADQLETDNRQAQAFKLGNETEAQTARDLKATLQGQQSPARAQLEKAEADRSQLAVDAHLLRACDELRIEPESGEVARLVHARLERQAQQVREAERAAEECEAAGKAIEEAGLSAVDANALRVAEALREAGVRDAQPYARWLAETGGDEGALRRFALTDPARFSGVYVPLAAHLPKAAGLDAHALALTRPVQVSMGGPPAQARTEALTVPVADASAYSLAAASARLQGLQGELKDLSQQKAQRESDHSALQASAQALHNYREAWGQGRLQALRDAIARRVREIAEATSTADEAAQQAVTLGKAMLERSARVETLRQQARDAHGCQDRIKDFERDWQAPLGGHRDAQRAAELALNQLSEQSAALQQAQTHLQDARVNLASRRSDIEGEKARLDTERNQIKERNAQAEPTNQGADALRGAYQTTLENLRAAEAGRLDGPRGQLSEMERNRAKLEIAYNKLHDELSIEGVTRRAAQPLLEQSLKEAQQHADQCLRQEGALNLEADTARKVADTSASKLSESSRAHLPHVAAFSDRQLPAEVERWAAQGQHLADAREQAVSTQQSQKGEIEKQQQRQNHLRPLRDQMRLLAEEAAPTIVRLAAEPDAISQQVSQCAQQQRDALKTSSEAERTAREHHDAVVREVRKPDFARLESTIAASLADNTLEAASEEAPRLAQQLSERIASVDADLKEMDADHAKCLDKLVELSKQAEHQLRQAESLGVVPASVPRFGGQRVLTMKNFWKDMNTALRRHRLDAYVSELALAQRVPDNAAMLAAECLMKIANVVTDRGAGVLGLQILKTNSEGELRHAPIHLLGSSGGERLTSALLLYLVLARLRAETRLTALASGGVLVLDNPFGSANKPLFLQMQRALAQAMDVQLIYTTGILDLNSLAEFPLIVRMRRGKKRGRYTLVEATRLIDGVTA